MTVAMSRARAHWDDRGNVMVTAPSLNAATARLCGMLDSGTLQKRGVWTQLERRGGPVREFNGMVTVTVEDVQRRLCWLPSRRLNPWVTLAEFPWIVAGRNDIGWLLPYLPRAKDFSDDGTTWRAGYGPRLRGASWKVRESRFDQLSSLVRRLATDHSSRQAVLSLWDSTVDYGIGSKDYPCTNWLHFMVRTIDGEERLDLSVVMRSNDLIWGFSGVNVTNFTLLQELVATCLSIKVGVYRHCCDNLHVYERHFKYLGRLALDADPEFDVLSAAISVAPRASIGNAVPSIMPTPALELDWFTDDCRRALFVLEQDGRVRTSSPAHWLGVLGWSTQTTYGEFSYLPQWLYFMSLHHCNMDWSRVSLCEWDELLAQVANPDWRLSAAALIEREAQAHPDRLPNLEGLLERVAGPIVNDGEEIRKYLEAAVPIRLPALEGFSASSER